MTGLDNILKQIGDDASSAVAEILRNAEAEAAGLVAKAKEDGRKTTLIMAEQAMAQAADLEARARSSAELENRKRVLEAKQGIIAELIEKAKASLYALPDEEYFALLLKMTARHAQPGKGEMLLSQKDLARLPKDFEKKLEKSMPKGVELTVAKEAGRLSGGFLLAYGGIEENCAFETLFAAAQEELQDGVHQLLFA